MQAIHRPDYPYGIVLRTGAWCFADQLSSTVEFYLVGQPVNMLLGRHHCAGHDEAQADE